MFCTPCILVHDCIRFRLTYVFYLLLHLSVAKMKAADFAETYVRTYVTARRHSFQDHSTNCWCVSLTLFVPCNKNVCFIYKTNICIHPIHNSIIYVLPTCFVDYVTIIWEYNTSRCLTHVQMWYSDKSKVPLFNYIDLSSCLYRASTVSRHFFIIPNWFIQL